MGTVLSLLHRQTIADAFSDSHLLQTNTSKQGKPSLFQSLSGSTVSYHTCCTEAPVFLHKEVLLSSSFLFLSSGCLILVWLVGCNCDCCNITSKISKTIDIYYFQRCKTRQVMKHSRLLMEGGQACGEFRVIWLYGQIVSYTCKTALQHL